MKKACIILISSIAIVCLLFINKQEKEEFAETQVFDTTYLELWCGEPTGRIYMIGARISNDGRVKDEAGNFWELDTEIERDSFLLLWVDNNGTINDIQDDILIKAWVELH
jgi:hypothetical protein